MFGHLVLSHLVLAYDLVVEADPFPKLVVIFRTLHIPIYFLDFTYDDVRNKTHNNNHHPRFTENIGLDLGEKMLVKLTIILFSCKLK